MWAGQRATHRLGTALGLWVEFVSFVVLSRGSEVTVKGKSNPTHLEPPVS